jgi:CDP-4-dehydro-6-deoxyglucose reductase
VAWESGFAHIQSLIDHAIQLDPDRPIHLYWLSAIPQGHYLSNYCRAWVDALDDFHYHSIDLAPAGRATLPAVVVGIVRDHAPLHAWDLYLCLPEAAVATTLAELDAAGLPAAQRRVTALRHP